MIKVHFSSSFSSKLVASHNCICNYKPLLSCFYHGATKDSYINSWKNGWFGHKLQMCGLEWTKFLVVNECITYIMGILLLPGCVNRTYEYITTWTNKHYIYQWMSCNIITTIISNGSFIFVNQIMYLLSYLSRHINLGLL
jgi:hypothetical protein